MVDTTPTRLGQDNGAGGVLDLYLTTWSGELINSYLERTVMLDKVRKRSVGPGKKTVTFDGIGDVGSGYHAAGEDILDPSNGLMQTPKHGRTTISIDSKLVCPIFIDDLDEFINHYDVRSEYMTKMGRRLARVTDSNLMQLVILGATQASGITDDHPGGLVVTDADAATNGASLLASIEEISATFDEKDVPEEDRFVVLKPRQYNLLVNETDLLNRDFGGSNGVFSEGDVRKAWGMTLLKSNHLPTTSIASTVADAVNGPRNEYGVDASNTVAIAFQRGAIGHIEAKGMTFEVEYQMQRQGHFMLASQAVGSNFLLPAACAQIKTA